MAKNLFSKFELFLIATSLYCNIIAFWKVSREVCNQGKPE
ncbi:hypothetical protein T4B_12574 [Trichinella pseudospiralis]|uniref:Uncharacterized protein n=1 Tax=Trichinella pseudospiralis TaxID=6337 RepID=A0A0V1GK77_TRIPS|nr:hypothetical protein T4B_7258 [Trichinella pseudospiralis]KRY98332.1 hypothetical protein T4B_10263 [Trichinella pseudospiralis]KRY98588.1 hypothetical protein T4B_12574 [Trichinella pseudospiralis]KRZ02141.1 hypothetical protein T4C_3886 [Trichinella pseudospiralis]KRZ04152.1 hypothetical protein T4C_53 [Trichinella pseudospiralis]